MTRPDDYEAIQKHRGRYVGGTALIVLGGTSGANWTTIRDAVQPDIILGANGVNAIIPDLDYWMLIENMNATAFKLQATGDAKAKSLMEMLNRTGAKTRLVHHLTYPLLKNTENAIKVNRNGIDFADMPTGFSFRQYELGYLSGDLMCRPEITASLRVGTVGLQLLHHAAFTGCDNVHTIGFDLCFKGERHHWYDYPVYEANRYWNSKMFTKHRGLDTMWFWLDTALYLKKLLPIFERDGVNWVDHSDGLLKAEGIALG